ncbi:hypothetical protein O6H91_14G071200 [Diphasiastrum complanatum]|uniref:Uncharacterized protein n=2 Tax=Diphasiastrum complanatum TaxID=34168 RepID=A0ACC2BQQ4_DIPCM|nr:hypothetical protein O6H91_14G071200 [Diphasiastrum complanatum]KAJ7532080.1 hypothetical protein O6H91_14G071200 [Diphasiastrum complanatum]
MQVKLRDFEAELLQLHSNGEILNQSYGELMEFQLVLHKAGRLFDSSHNNKNESRILEEDSVEYDESSDRPLLEEQEMQVIPSSKRRLGYITGLVAQVKVCSFERYLFRATRGNMLFKQAPVNDLVLDPTTGEKVQKVVFLVFFSGEWAHSKIMKICESFGASCYPFPEERVIQEQMKSEVASRLDELNATLEAGIRHRNTLLNTIGYQLGLWKLIVQKEKAIYHILNMLNVDVTRKCLVAEAWCPTAAKNQVQEALKRATLDTNSQVGVIFHELKTIESPPTYFKTNRFTSGFQEIVDAYGVARYQEVNPGVFTIITFPFLFAVMFGDWGHGLVLLLASLYLIFNERKLGSKKLDDLRMAFEGRYVFLLMSVFSIYTGFIYNEFFSVPFEIFGASTYKCTNPSCRDASTKGLIKAHSGTYPFGVDPVWHGSRSELPFLNSLKMKMSILLGVTQMMLGIILSFFNAKFFSKPLDIWFQFVPQILFLGAIFGYLSLLIVIKWCTGSRADLYHVMIYMFLSPSADLGENTLFDGQSSIQVFLLLLAVIAVPWMLLPKPLLLRKQHFKVQKLQGHMYNVLGDSDSDSANLEHENKEDSEFEFGEVFVHQLIHTIEFVLGAVSNTASYLRLWALSLAHAQLSSVFYEKVLLLSWSYENILIRMLGVIVFVSATMGVLLLMETLSAFLHALRLHWVEFQNKFYEGSGYKFTPFSLSELEDNK